MSQVSTDWTVATERAVGRNRQGPPVVGERMAPGETLRLVTLAVLALILGALVAARMLRKPEGARQLSVWAHLEELRRRFLIILASLVGGILFAMSFRIAPVVVSGFHLWIPVPDLYDNLSAQLFSLMAKHLVPAGVQLVALSPMDGFMAQFDFALGIGVLAAMPVLLYQLGRFFGPALRERERRWLVQALVPTVALFITGALFCYAAVLPITFNALYQFNTALDAQNWLVVNNMPSFALGFMLGFGLAFETPIVMYTLARVGLVQGRTFVRYWRHATVVIVVVSAFLTPDPTVVSQLMMAIPMLGLYAAGAGMALLASRRPKSAPL